MMVRRCRFNSTSSPAPLCRAGVLLLCLCPEAEGWCVRTAVSLRGEEPPANVLRSSYTCSLNAPVSEHESGFVVWTRLAGKYEVLPSRQPHLLEGKWGGKNKQLVETTFPTLRCLFPGTWSERAIPLCMGKLRGICSSGS